MTYSFAVVAYDRFGNASAPAIFSGQARAKRALQLPPSRRRRRTGRPSRARVCPRLGLRHGEKINPLTGNAMSEGLYRQAGAGGAYRGGNEVWDGKRQAVTLVAGRNDFAGFQLAIENLGAAPLNGVEVLCSALERETRLSEMNRRIRLSLAGPRAVPEPDART